VDRVERLTLAKQGLRAVERYIYHELGDEGIDEARDERTRALLRLTVGLRRKLDMEE
jgi:hypothetical protein